MKPVLKKLALIAMICAFIGQADASFAEEDEYKALFFAKQVFEDGFYDTALRQLEQFLKDYPHSKRTFDVEFLIGQCCLNEGNLYKAASLFESLLNESARTHPQRVDEILFWLAETYFKGKDYERAFKFYQRIIREFPESRFVAYAYYNSAWSLNGLKKYAEALNGFKNFAQRYPKHEYAAEAEYKIGEILLESNDYEQAKIYLEQYLKKQPKLEIRTGAYCLLGEVNYRTGNYAEAIRFYRLCLESGYRSKYAPYARYGIGWAYFDTGEYAESLRAFEEFMESFSHHELAESVLLQMGEAHRKLKQYDKALSRYEEMIRRFPQGAGVPRACFLKAQVFSEQGQSAQAVPAYEEIIKKFPQANFISDVYFNLGDAYGKINRKKEALEFFKQAADITKDTTLKVNALSRIADIYLDSGDVDQAQKVYDRIIVDFSGSGGANYAQYQLGLSFIKQGRFDPAILAFQYVINNSAGAPPALEARYQMGIAYFKQGNYKVGAEQLEEFLAEAPAHSLKDQALFYLATSRYNAKEFDKAIAVYNRVIKESKEAELLWQAAYQRAWCFYQSGNEKEAVFGFQECLTRFPQAPINADIQFWLGQHYMQKEEYPKACEYFNAVIKPAGNNGLEDDALFQLGLCAEKVGNAESAINQWQQLRRQYPRSEFIPESILKTAEALLALKKKEAACAEFQQLVTEYAGSLYAGLACEKLASIEEDNGVFGKAADYLRNALENPQLVPEFKVRLQYALGRVWDKAGDDTRALDEYLKLVYLYPEMREWVGKAYMSAGQIFERENEYKKAATVYYKIIEAELPEKDKAKERVECLEKE